jgi:hypothetical protein
MRACAKRVGTATAIAVAALVLVAVAPAIAGPADTFVLSGAVKGTLTNVSSVCGASKSAADVQFQWFGNVTSLTGTDFSTKSIVSIEVDLAGKGYGKSGKLSGKSLHHTPFVTFSYTNGINSQGTFPPIWRSAKGSYSTSANGTSGTLHVTLKATQTAHPHGQVTLSGSWSACPPASGT